MTECLTLILLGYYGSFLNRWYLLCLFFLWASVGLFSATTALAYSINLGWDPNSEPDLEGYILYTRQGSPCPPYDYFTYYPEKNLANPLSPCAGIIGLKNNLTYYFVITAYDAEGNESHYSSPVSVLNGKGANAICSSYLKDVSPRYWAEEEIYTIYDAGITAGCSKSPLKYCPTTPVTRAQMAIFLLKSKLGSGYTPPPATGIFDDVPVGSFAEPWIEDLYNRGITAGCSKSPLKYCPSSPVTRQQMAIFLLKSKLGSGYTPPPATGIFSDVPVTYRAADWIEQLSEEGIAKGCGTNPLRYCPESSVTRAQMAVFIVRTFGL
jgi:hypothetical protein